MMDVEELKKATGRDDIEVVMLVESGSQVFGWYGPDSDYDIRGVYIDPLNKIVSLHPGKDCIVNNPEGALYDYQLFEAKKFLNQILKPNFNMMEWVYCPIQYYVDQEFYRRVREVAELCVCKKIGAHARGWSYSIYKMDWNNPKKCLMALRPLMVYQNLLVQGEWQSDIRKLTDKFHPDLCSLVSALLKQRADGKATGSSLKDLTNKWYGKLCEITVDTEKHTDMRDKPDPHAFALAEELLWHFRTKDISKEETR